MLLSIAKNLGMLQDLKPTLITLQLAEKSIVKPDRILEDIYVKVDKYIFPVDFVILEMEEDKEVPLILSRPFFATGDAWIAVKDKTVVFNFNGELVVFDVDQATRHPAKKMDCCEMDIMGSCITEILLQA